MRNLKKATYLANQIKKYQHYNRVLVAKNYDTLSFNYRGIGRWQVRFHNKPNSTIVEVVLNGKPLEAWTWNNPNATITPKELTHALDIVIDNTQELYYKAVNID